MKCPFRCCIAGLVLLLAGCEELPKMDPVKMGPFFTPANVSRAAPSLPADFRRVVVLPLTGPAVMTEDNLSNLDTVVLAELNRTNRFEVVAASRDALARLAGARSFSSVEALPTGLMERLARAYGADGVLFLDITHYDPYPPLSVGLRAKLARLRDSEILWSADNLFAAANPAVANSARRYASSLTADRDSGDLSYTALQNPSRFVAYVANATFSTLPVR